MTYDGLTNSSQVLLDGCLGLLAKLQRDFSFSSKQLKFALPEIMLKLGLAASFLKIPEGTGSRLVAIIVFEVRRTMRLLVQI